MPTTFKKGRVPSLRSLVVADGSPPGTLGSHPTLPPALVRECWQLFDHFCEDAERGLSGLELRKALAAMGLEYTDPQVKDIIFNLSQSHAVKTRNRQNLVQQLKETVRSTTTTAESSGESALHLGFDKFLELLTMTLEDCQPDRELQATFGAMDLDKDGILSATDLQATLRSVLGQEFHLEEVEEMLQEADWDNDKVVTLEDFKRVLDTN
eukprot:GGOE01036399.1.p1 GENE.GGOE01036399.1~~GGOE01036399.1.p1  ORF type:complete len:210 (+),score=78.15 GGOE01036399.1:63-692(+)